MNVALPISTVICTHNRAAFLRKALRSLEDQSLRKDDYEIIVVDNASTDDTAAACAEFPGVRRVAEPRLGLNVARETGRRNAAGRYVAYLDDDAVACRDWLSLIVAAFETVQPRPGTVGGRIDLVFERDPPPWLTEGMRRNLAQVNWSPDARWLREKEWVAGCNIAFDKEALERAGGFDEAFDRRGANLLSGGDILMMRKIEKLGRRSFYQPAASVRHFVPASRLDHRWFLRRSYWQGVSDAMMDIALTKPTYWQGVMTGWREARLAGIGMEHLLRVWRTYDNVAALAGNLNTLYRLGKAIGYLKRSV